MSNKQLCHTLKRFVIGLYTTKDIQYLKESLKTNLATQKLAKRWTTFGRVYQPNNPKCLLKVMQ